MKLEVRNEKLDILRRQIERGIFPHAYLFSGSDENSKNEAVEFILVNILGKDWARSLDFAEISDNPITINEIRSLKSRAYSAPISGVKNVFVIRNIENLSRDAAPALLKLLEDPPKSALIIATTINQKALLQTIQSRFSILRFYKKLSSADEIVSQQLRHVEKKARELPDFISIKCFEEALWARGAMLDQTINKRLLNEYLTMLAA